MIHLVFQFLKLNLFSRYIQLIWGRINADTKQIYRTWLMHCHIAWHASQGFALQFVERESEITATIKDSQAFNDTCRSWDNYIPGQRYKQDDSGI
jgi:hypothetical protein